MILLMGLITSKIYGILVKNGIKLVTSFGKNLRRKLHGGRLLK
jgi:hypothetical protein